MVTIVDGTGTQGGTRAVGNQIIFDNKDFKDWTGGAHNVDNRTMGAGMMFFHEYGHTPSGGKRADPLIPAVKQPNRDRIGENERVINEIRKELGPGVWSKNNISLCQHWRKQLYTF